MPAQTPGIGYVADSEVGLLRKIVNNTAITAAGGGGGGGAVASVNGQTGVVVLDAVDVGAVATVNGNPPDGSGDISVTAADVGAVGLTGDETIAGLKTFNLIPNVSWTSKATGSSTSTLNTQYYITTFNANTTITSYVGTPANGSKVAYLLRDCSGTNTFTFPAAQRSGDPTGTSTVLTPTPGTHMIVFTYVNGAWVYQDDIVLAGVVTSGTFTVPIVTTPLTLAAYEAYNKVLTYGANGQINLPVGVAGMNILIYNTGAFTITIEPNGSEVIVRDGTAQTGGVNMTLSSGAGNFVALYNNGTCWITLGFKGVLAVGS